MTIWPFSFFVPHARTTALHNSFTMPSPIPEGLYRIFNGKTKGALWLPKADDGTLTEVGDLDEGDERYEVIITIAIAPTMC